jgi:hypothetical protein
MEGKEGNNVEVSTPTTENIESSKLEWGPDLGEMSWYDAQTKIAELNSTLPEGEKPWRLPTKDELVAEFKKTGSTPADFQRGAYWSETTLLPDRPNVAFFVSVEGIVYNDTKGYPHVLARCVR